MTRSAQRSYVSIMKPGALATALAILGLTVWFRGPAVAESERVRGCMSPNQAREVLINQKLIAPFRALGEASRGLQGDAVGLQLCRLGEEFVYDVTLLRHDGHVSHALVNARSGMSMTPARTAKERVP